MRAFSRIYDGLFGALGVVSALLIGAVAVGITYDVLGRNIGFGTVSWMLEACEYAIFMSTFLAGASLHGLPAETLRPEIDPTPHKWDSHWSLEILYLEIL